MGRPSRKMRITQRLLMGLVVLLPFPALGWWPPDDTQRELGLPMVTTGALEVRVWLGGGVLRPYDLFRIRQSPAGATGELIAWSDVTQPDDDLDSPREARRENASMRKLLRKEYCASELHETSAVMWCTAKTRHQPHWPVLLNDLMPEQLWNLPEDVPRDCGLTRLDGEIITIELVQGSRYHAVTYSNPDFCCAEIPCALANHVRYILRFNAR